MNEDEKAEKIALLTEQMQRAAMELEFETAAKLRDELYRLQGRSDGASDSAPKPGTRPQYRARTSKKWSCESVCRPKTGRDRFHGNYIYFVYFFDKNFIYKHIILYRFYNFRPNL